MARCLFPSELALFCLVLLRLLLFCSVGFGLDLVNFLLLFFYSFFFFLFSAFLPMNVVITIVMLIMYCDISSFFF